MEEDSSLSVLEINTHSQS